MRELKQKIDAAIVLITHDLGVVAEMAQRVVVMYAGRKAEEAPVGALFRRPLHPYTKGLLEFGAAARRLARSRATPPRLAEIPGTVPSLREAIRRLRVRGALRLCDRHLPPRDAGFRGEGARAFRRLLSLRPGGRGMREPRPDPRRSRARCASGSAVVGHGPGQAFPGPQGAAAAHRRTGPCGRRHLVRHRRRRDPGPRRRERLRQVDRRQGDPQTDRADRRRDPHQRRAHRRAVARARCGPIGASCRWCSRTPIRR